MEILTVQSEILNEYRLQDNSVNGCQKAINKLADYEDAEEQGLLLRLPCKVGDTLYVIRKLCDGKETRVIEETVAKSFDLRTLQRYVLTSYGHRLNFANFGKTVFLTRAEAEHALAERVS